jgi:hypothetical protein
VGTDLVIERFAMEALTLDSINGLIRQVNEHP